MSEENTEQPVTFTQEQVDVMISEKVSRMESKMDELLGETKAAKAKRKEAEVAAQLAAEDAAKKSGSMEELEKTINARHSLELEGYKSQLKDRDNLILGGKKSELIAGLAGEFTSPEAAKLMLSNMVEASYGDDNNVLTQFKSIDGSVVTTDPAEFVKHLKSNDAFKPFLKAVDSSGGSANGSKSHSGAIAGNDSDYLKRLRDAGLT